MPRKIAANTIAGMQQRQGRCRDALPPRRAVHRAGLEHLLRQRLQPGEDDDEHERRPLPGVDDHQHAQRHVGIEQPVRVVDADLADQPGDQAPVGVQQRPPHQADDDRRQQHRQDQDPAHDAGAAQAAG